MITHYGAKDLEHFVARPTIDGKIMDLIVTEGHPGVSVAIGGPGLGKSMLLSKLYQDACQRDKYHPIWLNTSERYLGVASRNEAPNTPTSWLMSVEEYRTLREYRKLLETMAEDLPPETFGDFRAQVSEEWSRFEKRLHEHRIDLSLNEGNSDALIHQNENLDNAGTPDGEPVESASPTGVGEAGDGNMASTGSSQVGRDSYENSTVNQQQFGGARFGDEAKVGTVIGRDAYFAVQRDQAAPILAIEGMEQFITDEFVRRLNELGQDCRVVLFIDDFQKILNRSVAEWIMDRLVRDLKNVAVVIARTDSDQKLQGTWERLELIELEPFSQQEIAKYLKECLGSSVQEGLAGTIRQFTLGHPQAVGMAVDCVREYRDNDPDLLQVFEHIPDDQVERIWSLISKLESAIEDRDLKLALNIGGVVRRFDAGLLQYIMFHWEDNPKAAELSGKYHELIERMQEYSFVQSGPGDARYHRTIREVMDEWLRNKDPMLHEKLHSRAARYFEERMRDRENEQNERFRSTPDKQPYKKWYSYEDPVWQDNMIEWLYHETAISNKTAARLIFLRRYFDAFWWWEAYRKECKLCEQLQAEWREAHNQGKEDQDDLDWVELLKDLQDAYASGYQRESEENWVEVEKKLVQVRTELDFEGEVDPSDKERYYLKAMTDFFLAQAYRFRNPQDEKAVLFYEKAYGLFVHTANPDIVLAAWTSYHLSDLYLERGEYNKALEKCQETLEFIRVDRLDNYDYILKANNYRVQADAYWGQGNFDKAFSHYASAVFATYAFLAKPSRPKEYTVDFYREMANHTLDRVESLWDDGRANQAIQISIALRDFWKPYYNRLGMPEGPWKPGVLAPQNRRVELKRYLFPPEPGFAEYQNEHSDFAQNINWIVHDRGGTI